MIFAVILAAAFMMRPLKVFAASGKVYFKTDKTEVDVNEVFTVYLCLESDTQIGEFSCYILYDENRLGFYKGDNSVQGDDGSLKVSVHSTETAADSKQILMKFVAKATGNIIFSATDAKMFDVAGMPISLLGEDLTIQIKAAEDANSDATLKSLRISPGTLTPAFSPDVYEYRTEVSGATGSIYVSAVANDEKAKVGIYGHTAIFPGENTVRIIVTAENGSMQEYSVVVVRDNPDATPTPTETPTEAPTPTPEPTPTQSIYRWRIETYDEDGSSFIAGTFNFEIIEDPKGYEIPAGFEKTKLVIAGKQVTVFAPDASAGSEFVLLVLRKDGQDAAVYRYDRSDGTLQRFVKEDITIRRTENTVNEEVIKQLKEYKDGVTGLGLALALVAGLWLVTAVLLIFFIRKSKEV